MDFGLPDWVQEKTERIRRLVAGRPMRPPRPGLDRDSWREVASCGMFETVLSKEQGGALAAFALFDAMGAAGLDRGLLFAMGAHFFGCTIPLAAYANPEQNARWVKGLTDGSIVGALAVTEPRGGSSLDLIATEAADAPGGFTLTGEKTLICNAPEAGITIVLARQFKDRGPLGLTAFLVPAGAAGLAVTPLSTAGLKGAPMGRIVLDRCFVPADGVLGRPGTGLRVFATAMQWERVCLLAGFLGAAERDLSLCLDALRARRDAGGSVLRHQGLSHRLARLKLKLESARAMGMRSASSIDRRRDTPETAAMAKLAISEAVAEVAQDLLKLMAGQGWQGQPVDCAAAFADVVGGMSASGTSEIQLDIIARSFAAEPRRWT